MSKVHDQTNTYDFMRSITVTTLNMLGQQDPVCDEEGRPINFAEGAPVHNKYHVRRFMVDALVEAKKVSEQTAKMEPAGLWISKREKGQTNG